MEFRSRRGQSLVELLIGIAVAAIFVVGAATAVVPSLQVNQQAGSAAVEAQLGQELIKNVQAWTGEDWDGVLALATGTANPYYLNTSSSPFTISNSTGTQYVAVNGTSYDRYFYLSPVYRDSNGNVTSTPTNNYYDPSTMLVTVVVAAASSTAPPITYPFYVTRNASNVLEQTTWSGGSGQTGAVTVITNTYAAATSVTTNASGSLQLSGSIINSCTL